MATSNHSKVDLAKVKKDLIERIRKIDASNDSQTVRTKNYERAARTARSKLFEDGRKSQRNRLALSSYGRYLSDVRKALRAEGWKHHTLLANIEKYSKAYPELADLLASLNTKDSETRRKSHTKLLSTTRNLSKGKDEARYRTAYGLFKGIKLDHEVLSHLAMSSLDKDDISSAAKEALEKKKTNSLTFNTHEIQRVISRNIYAETFGNRAVALGLACGRRPVEILCQGQFKLAGEFELRFTGHAKKRGGIDYANESQIYTLIPANEFLKALKEFRKMEPVKALEQYQELPEAQRNVEINRRTAKTLNTAAKRLLKGEERMFKDTRAIWARSVFDNHYKTDKKWKKVDEDIFWREMLGHKEDDTQAHYKHIKLVNTAIKEEPEDEKPEQMEAGERVKILEVVGTMEAVTKRKALAKINSFVLEAIKTEPETTITQTFITKGLGANRKAIKDYIEILETNYPETIG